MFILKVSVYFLHRIYDIFCNINVAENHILIKQNFLVYAKNDHIQDVYKVFLPFQTFITNTKEQKHVWKVVQY